MEELILPRGNDYQESDEEQMLRSEVWGKPPPLIVKFYIGAERDFAASEAEGAPVYKEKVLALVQVRGDKDCMTVPVTDEHIERYPKEWRLFKQACEKPRAIPLEALPKMRPHIKAALQELKVNTVQELAAADVPEYLKPWKTWAVQINSIHDFANGKPKPKLKLIDGQMVAA